jgi:hypothetical protein
MSATEDGGPAFPYSVHMEGFDRLSFPGMTLRDYFAGQAVQTLIDAQGFTSDLGKQAYLIADAMLAARALIAAEGETK